MARRELVSLLFWSFWGCLLLTTVIGCNRSAGRSDAEPQVEAGVVDKTGDDDAGGPMGPEGSAEAGSGGHDVHLLSSTGLYSDIEHDVIAEGVRPFTPRSGLWTDGASKRRWVYLPEGQQIHTGDMDEWSYPEGTKLWKEFTRDGVRVETRLLEKDGSGFFGWRALAFVWNEDQTDAVATPDGLENAKGTEHDVPSEQNCNSCHFGRPDFVLGFTALQLSHEDSVTTLRTLIEEDLLSDPPDAPFEIPGTDLEKQVLGMLHANCGHCHNPYGDGYERNDMELWLKVSGLGALETTTTYETAVRHGLDTEVEGHTLRVNPGEPKTSGVLQRMLARGVEDIDMPPLGTELPDVAAAELVRQWIEEL